jgi:hypothetical protein
VDELPNDEGSSQCAHQPLELSGSAKMTTQVSMKCTDKPTSVTAATERRLVPRPGK